MASHAAGLRPEQLLAHAGWIRRLARGLVTQDADADDAVQQTWLAALEARPSARRSLRPWLAHVLRAQIALWRRRSANRSSREAIVAADDALPSVEEIAIRAETQRRLVEAVVALPEPYRSAIVLHYYEDLSAAEIARRRGVPSATLRSQIHRGLARLRAQLDRDFDGDRRAWTVALLPLQRAAEHAEPSFPASRVFSSAAAAKLLVAGVIAGAVAWWAFDARDAGAVSASERAEPESIALASHSAPLADERRVAPADALRAATALAAQPGPFVARVLDDDTGDALPGFHVVLHTPGGDPRSATSDASGTLRFDLAGDVAGLCEFELLDDARLFDRDARVHGAPLEIRVPREIREPAASAQPPVLRASVGPTYVLDLERPAGLELSALRAHLRANTSYGFATELWSMHVAPVREPGPFEGPWVRFAALETAFLGHGPSWTLEVASADGLWAGRALVTSLRGCSPGSVHVALQPGARLSGRVLDALGPITRDVLLDLRRPDGSPTGRRADTDDTGRFAFAGLEPGDYELRVGSARHERRSVTVTVAPGGETALDVELARSPVAGEVDGLLSSRTRRYREPVVVVLESTDSAGRRFYAQSKWDERAGSLVSPFSFAAVPRGRYRLSVLSIRDQLAWQPAVVELDAPAHALSLECLDDAPSTSYALDVRGALDEDAPMEFTIVFAVDGGREVTLARVHRSATPSADELRFEWQVRAAGLTWGNRSGPAPIARVPRGARLEWAVFADGCAPRFGDETAFIERGESCSARIELERGWGRRMRILEGATGRALPDVELWADGQRIATSCVDGNLDVRLPRAPQDLELKHALWTPIDRSDLANSAPALCCEVSMTPP